MILEQEIPAPYANRNVYFWHSALQTQHDVDFGAFSAHTHTRTNAVVCDLTQFIISFEAYSQPRLPTIIDLNTKYMLNMENMELFQTCSLYH